MTTPSRSCRDLAHHCLCAALALAPVLGALAGCGGVQKVAEPVVAPPVVPLAGDAVVVVPTLGNDHLRSKVWTVASVTELVTALDPAVVLVDCNAAELAVAAGETHDARGATLRAPSPELLHLVARRPELPSIVAAAVEHGAEAVAYSTADDAARAELDDWLSRNPFGGGVRENLLAQAAWYRVWFSDEAPNDLEFIAGAWGNELAEASLRWLSATAEEQLGSTGILRALAREAATIEDTLAAHPGQTVVILVPVDRRWYLEGAIDSRFPGRRVDLLTLLPTPSP